MNLTPSTRTRRLCIFSFYDPQGVVDDYVVYFLKELGNHVDQIAFYSNGALLAESELKIEGLVAEIVIRPNFGFDVLAYKEGLEKIDFDREHKFDEVLMVNHTCYGPIYPFEELFTEMEKRSCDFWGVTAHMEMVPNPFTGTGKLPYHINTNFVAVRSGLLHSPPFKKYWQDLQGAASYEAAIQGHETLFTEHFTNLGYVSDTYLDCAKYGTHYPAILDIDETLIDRNPLLKRRALFHDPRFLEHYAADLPRALQVVEETSDYDQSLIWENVIRVAELRNLNTNAALTSIFPDIRLKRGAPQPDYGRIAVCAHVYYTEMLDELIELADTIPGQYDFIATTHTPEKKAFIEQKLSGKSNIGDVIVRVVEQNRGRDMSSLFITCRDLFLDDRYQLVCRLHTKKSPQVAAGRANMFKRHMFENLMNSPGYTANVLDMFHDKPWIGMAVPPLVHIGYPTMGHVWFSNRERAEALKEALDLKVNFDPETPVGAFGTMFWFRPKALRKLFEHPWQWEGFDAEPNHVDGSLAHVLERLMCYVAQDAGYTTQQIISSHLASWNFSMLEYKLQKFSAALPNADFTGQFNFLDHWKRTGYRIDAPPHPVAAPEPDVIEMGFLPPVTLPSPPTISQALSTLALSTKRSVAHRFPGLYKLLKP
ncbi:rhamnan synthesis F family protein [Xanthomonas hortorum]|uniref:rhamnan synthesis F family protein n=1 Tax=Xanthomonas hortorum TaxID=56454 RepID=UPI0029354AA4|nr:rhamnan synthesis F family protein [Xanthomonas hortorum]MDV2449658.1 rhamnan synthesis F family protein [Xanthomonas hortorum NBC5720]